MPVPVIKKEAEKHGVSKNHTESMWEKAKSQADKEYGKEKNSEYWAEVMSIFKSMMKDKK